MSAGAGRAAADGGLPPLFSAAMAPLTLSPFMIGSPGSPAMAASHPPSQEDLDFQAMLQNAGSLDFGIHQPGPSDYIPQDMGQMEGAVPQFDAPRGDEQLDFNMEGEGDDEYWKDFLESSPGASLPSELPEVGAGPPKSPGEGS